MGTLTVPGSSQPSTIAKEENGLCAFPPKTDEANLALNAGGEEQKLAFLMGFKKWIFI